ncbi:low molecular weight protein-tyrosine-phosphatase [Eubacterium pyruvativorans]|uniref:low molecular weight protein-tyrosine-phosphatase n=1 Tax=Eubacterium pyruvativorans TaxID=155865 RepID=UPI003F88FF33
MKKSILFVCHGNICRSVSAQYIFENLVHQSGLDRPFFVDSAATSREEIGSPIYPPMERALRRLSVPVGTHRARQLRREDYDQYDLLIGMDEENAYYMRRILGDDPDHKVHFLMEYTDRPDAKIEDPWYTRNFDLCASEITEGCRGLLEALRTVRP